jgi:hypothetical protein
VKPGTAAKSTPVAICIPRVARLDTGRADIRVLARGALAERGHQPAAAPGNGAPEIPQRRLLGSAANSARTAPAGDARSTPPVLGPATARRRLSRRSSASGVARCVARGWVPLLPSERSSSRITPRAPAARSAPAARPLRGEGPWSGCRRRCARPAGHTSHRQPVELLERGRMAERLARRPSPWQQMRVRVAGKWLARHRLFGRARGPAAQRVARQPRCLLAPAPRAAKPPLRPSVR